MKIHTNDHAIRRRGLRRIVAPMITALAVIGSLAAGGTAAVAAPTYATEGSITSLDFVAETVTSGRSAELTATWSLPDDPTTPAGFTIDLPADLAGRGDTFPIVADDGSTIATCVATPTQLQCDFDAGYLTAHPRDLHGDVNFWVRVNTDVTETTEHVYSFGEVAVPVVVNPRAQCTTDCAFDWSYHKDGGYRYADDTIVWYAHVAAPREGMAGGMSVAVRDLPAGNQTLVVDGEYPRLTSTTEVGRAPNGAERPVNFRTVPREAYTIDADGTVRFTSEQGHFYEVVYLTAVQDGGASGTYENTVEFEVNGYRDGSASQQVRYAGGGGTGVGTDVGVFTITKALAGTAQDLPADLSFTGTYAVQPPTGEAVTGTYEVRAGQSWRSPEFPRGSIVSLTEDAPSGSETLLWGTPAFSSQDFALEGGKITAVTLTNTADLRLGSFAVRKQVTGSGADLVPTDTLFTLDYAYPAGLGFAAGSGTLTLALDGEAVSSGPLPAGAVVTLSEATPAHLPSGTWTAAEFDRSEIVIGADTVAEITLTNTFEENPPVVSPEPPEEPENPGTPAEPGTPEEPVSPILALTGTPVSAGLTVAGAIALFAIGSGLIARARRARAGD